MSNKTINASSVDIFERQEKESIDSDIKIDIAVVLPLLDDDVENLKIDFDYGTIAKTVNDYINRDVIDCRIERINYSLSVPDLPDASATINLRDALMGSVQEISTSAGEISIENKAINNNKVTKTFELSIVQNVYLENNPEENTIAAKKTEKSASKYIENSFPTGDNRDLVIKSASPTLYWTNPAIIEASPTSAPKEKSENIAQSFPKVTINREDTIETAKKIGDGIDSGMGITNNRVFNTTNVGNNGKLYSNPHARGNQYYKITGNIGESKAVKRLGTAGKLISYSATATKAYGEYQKATTDTEKGRVIGGTIGEVGTGIAAGWGASAATSAVLVTVAGAFGVATAPVTIVIIAGCAIIAGVAASNAAEPYGRNVGEKAGEKAIETWKSISKNTKQ